MIRGPIDGKYVELWGIPAWRRKLGIGDESETLTQRIESIIAGTANGGPDSGPGSVDNANARLAAFATLEEAGYVVQTSTFPPAFAGRQIIGVPNRINVTHGTGILGNTVLQTPQDIHEGATPAFQTIKPLLLNPDFVTYVDSAGELASTTVTASALESAVAMDVLTTLGDLLTHDGMSYVRFPIGTDDQFLRVNGTNINWETITAAAFPHTLLDATVHTDTATQTVSRGSIVYGNSAPAWDELVKGAANTVLRSNATDVLWGQVVLTTDVTGVLPVANGGTNASSWTAGSIIFAGAGGTSLAQDNANIFWDDGNNRQGLGTTAPDFRLDVRGNGNNTTTAGIQIRSLVALGNTSAGALLNLRAIDSSGFIASFPSDYAIASQADRLVVGANSDATGVTVIASAAAQDIRFLAGNTTTVRAIINSTGFGVGNSAPGALFDLGLAGTTLGVMRLAGSTSGNVTIQPQAIAGTWTLQLPANDGNGGDVLTTDGGGITSWAAPVTAGHAILSATHTDTLASAVSRGSLIVGNATPLWAELNVASRKLLTCDGTDTAWSTDLTWDEGVNELAVVDSNAVGTVVNYYNANSDNTAVIFTQEVSYGFKFGVVGSVALFPAGLITAAKEMEWTTAGSTQYASIYIETMEAGTVFRGFQVHSSGSCICGKDSTGTTRTDDFTYICQTNGVPTGVPTAFGNRVAMTFDPNTDTFYIYRGGWKGVVVV